MLKKNLPNILTITRIFLTPIIVVGIAHHRWTSVFILLVVAALTDTLDGHLARWLDGQTEFGAYLDPIADKFLLVSCFATLSFIDSPLFSIPFWFVLFVCMREILLLSGSFYLVWRGVGVRIAPSVWGKLTTFFQLLFILWIFVCYFVGWNPVKTYGVLLVLLTVFSFISLGQYVKTGILCLYGRVK